MGQRLNANAQIKLGETIAVMVIFFFLLIFGMTFYARIQQASLEREAVRQLKMRSVQVTLKATSMAELQYGLEEGTLDLLKVISFEKAVRSSDDFRLYYFDVFGYSEIYLHQTFPESANYSIYTNLPGNTSFYQLIETPVAIFNATSGRYTFGILGAKVFSR